MLLLVWILTITALDTSAPTQPPANYRTQHECQEAKEVFIKSHMYTNWQGLTMAPLVRTSCLKNDGG